MTVLRRVVAAAALVLACATVLGGQAAGAQSGIPQGCTDATGVTVVVDFGPSLGGKVAVGCAEQPVATGLDALGKAGFDVTQVLRQPGFVCRVDGQPASDACITTPPVTAYWSYWYRAPASAAWVYSSLGAANRTPPAGSIEGWAFAASTDGSAPSPPRLPATGASSGSPGSAPPPTSAPPAASGGGSPGASGPTTAPGSTGPSATSRPRSGAPAGTSTTAATSSPPVTSTSVAASGATSTTTEAAIAVESASAARKASPGRAPSSGSSSMGTVVALAALVALGTGGAVVARRRSRRVA